jgi:hypothetical protein
LGDGEREQEKIVGQKGQSRLFLDIEVNDAAQGIEIALGRADAGQANSLIATQASGVIDGTRGAEVELHIPSGARDEKRRSLREEIKSSEVHIATIHQVERANFEDQLIQQVDVVHLPASQINTGRNAGPQIQQGVQLDRALSATKLRPGEQ